MNKIDNKKEKVDLKNEETLKKEKIEQDKKKLAEIRQKEKTNINNKNSIIEKEKVKNNEKKHVNMQKEGNIVKQDNLKKQESKKEQGNINKEKKETTKITQDTIIFKPIKNNQETNIVKSPQINKKENSSENKAVVENIENKEKQKNIDINKIRQDEIKETKKKIIEEQIKTGKKSHNKKIIIFIIIIVVLIAIISTIFGILNINNEKINKGILINNIDVSDLEKELALSKLEKELNGENINIVKINRNEYSKEIKLSDINGKFIVNDAVDKAYNLTRTNNLVKDNYKILLTGISKNNIDAEFTYDEEKLNELIDNISLDMPDLATNSSYVIKDNQLIIKNSTNGIKIEKEAFKNNLIKCFSGQEKSFEISVAYAEKEKIDMDKIYKEVYKEPVNAYYTENPLKIYKEENGIDFAISLEEAKKMIEKDELEYKIPLKVVKPKIKMGDLDSKAFPNTLGKFTTTYGTGDVNRNTNISVAAKSINSVVLMPGEVFSFNNLIGECSTRTGYKAATIYLNGELSTGVGGGICQVSTTLYNAVLRANLEIVARRNHSLGVTYVPSGQDAMVSIGTQDFKFKNNREYPIKVVAKVGVGSITCEIQGLSQDVEYDVKLYSRTISSTETNYKVETYKILYLNGKEVSRTWLSTDTYKYHKQQ